MRIGCVLSEPESVRDGLARLSRLEAAALHSALAHCFLPPRRGRWSTPVGSLGNRRALTKHMAVTGQLEVHTRDDFHFACAKRAIHARKKAALLPQVPNAGVFR